jgi:hypothetical protein
VVHEVARQAFRVITELDSAGVERIWSLGWRRYNSTFQLLKSPLFKYHLNAHTFCAKVGACDGSVECILFRVQYANTHTLSGSAHERPAPTFVTVGVSRGLCVFGRSVMTSSLANGCQFHPNTQIFEKTSTKIRGL